MAKDSLDETHLSMQDCRSYRSKKLKNDMRACMNASMQTRPAELICL